MFDGYEEDEDGTEDSKRMKKSRSRKSSSSNIGESVPEKLAVRRTRKRKNAPNGRSGSSCGTEDD